MNKQGIFNDKALRKGQLRKAMGLQLRLAQEEITASIGAVLIAMVCVALAWWFPISIFALIIYIVGLVYADKALCKLFIEHRYGDTSIFIKAMPPEESVSEKAGYYIGTALVFLLSMLSVICCGIWYWKRFDFSLSAVIGYLKGLYGWSGLEVSNGAVLAALVLLLLVAVFFALAAAECFEYRILKARKRGKIPSMTDKQADDNLLGFVLFIAFLMPRLLLPTISGFPRLYLPFVLTAITAAAFFAIRTLNRRLRHELENAACASDTVRKQAEQESLSFIRSGDGAKKDKFHAYMELIGRKKESADEGKLLTPSNCLIFLLCIFNIRNLVAAGDKTEIIFIAAAVIFILCMLCLTAAAQSRNSELLFEENASFYYSLPLSAEEVVRAHMMTAFHTMLPVTISVWVLIVLLLVIPFTAENMAELLLEIFGRAQFVGESIWLALLSLLWLAIMLLIALLFSAFAFFNSVFASGWKDPITHKTSKLPGGLCLSAEIFLVIMSLYALTQLSQRYPLSGNLLSLAVFMVACHAHYRRSIAALRSMYSG